jgi:hypothetical protein
VIVYVIVYVIVCVCGGALRWPRGHWRRRGPSPLPHTHTLAESRAPLALVFTWLMAVCVRPRVRVPAKRLGHVRPRRVLNSGGCSSCVTVAIRVFASQACLATLCVCGDHAFVPVGLLVVQPARLDSSVQVRMLGRIHRNLDPVPSTIRVRVISARNLATSTLSGAPSTFVMVVRNPEACPIPCPPPPSPLPVHSSCYPCLCTRAATRACPLVPSPLGVFNRVLRCVGPSSGSPVPHRGQGSVRGRAHPGHST